MKSERIVEHIKKQIEKYKHFPEIGSDFKIEALNEIINYISTYDKPAIDEVSQLEKVFAENFGDYLFSTQGRRPKSFTFNKQEVLACKKFITQIKQWQQNEIEEDDVTLNQYIQMPVYEFFDLFLKNMSDWRKQFNFNVITLNRHFKPILNEIMSNPFNNPNNNYTDADQTNKQSKNNANHNGHNKNINDKPEVEDVYRALVSRSNNEG